MQRFRERWHQRLFLRRHAPAPTVTISDAAGDWRCDRCSRLPHDLDLIEDEELQHHDSLAQLEHWAARGCVLCRVLWTCLVTEHPDLDAGREAGQVPCTVLVKARRGMTPRLWFSVGVRTVALELKVWCRELALHDGPPQRAPKRLAPGHVEADLEAMVRDTIQPWLKSCRRGDGRHAECRWRQGREAFRPPTRLIDVGSAGKPVARLVDTAGASTGHGHGKLDYLILSYCWGGAGRNEAAKTTRANLARRQRHLDVAALPKTVRDAVLLTRAMRVRYLWVDAVCIVQPHADDEGGHLDDWSREVPRMGAYYANARCLISVLAASDSAQGFLRERRARRFDERRCVVGRRVCAHRLDAAAQGHEDLVWAEVPDPDADADDVDASPLAQRAWYLQERLLAPRILHWTATGLSWECRGLVGATESDPDGRRCHYTGAADDDDDEAAPLEEQRAVLDTAATGLGWLALVSGYARLALTHEADRLAAIHGVAARLARRRGDEYWCGVFRSALAEGLLWWTPPPPPCRSSVAAVPAPTAGLPSWSWASRAGTGRLDFVLLRTDHAGHSLVHSPAGPFPSVDAPLRRGEQALALSAPLLRLTGLVADEPPADDGFASFRSAAWPRIVFDVCLDSGQPPAADISLVLLSTGRFRAWRDVQLNGLVVRRVAGRRGPVYERVGAVALEMEDDDDDDDNEENGEWDFESLREVIELI